MDKQQYDEGYRHGAGSTQDQARGARDAQLDRERREREERERWDQINQREQEERQRRLEQEREAERRRDEERREAERRKAATSSTSSSSPSSSSSSTSARPRSKDGSAAQGVIALIGLVTGAVLGYSSFPENWIAIGICAAVTAGIAAVLYKLIIGIAILIAALWIWVEWIDTPSEPHENVNSANNAGLQPPLDHSSTSPIDTTLAPTYSPSAPASPEPSTISRELRFSNYCRFPIDVALEYQGADGRRYVNGYWNIPADARDWRLLEDVERPLSIASGSILFTARIPGQDYEWAGTFEREFNGQTLRMMSQDLGLDAYGHYTFGVQCDNFAGGTR